MSKKRKDTKISDDAVSLIIDIISEDTGLPVVIISNSGLFQEQIDRSRTKFSEFCCLVHEIGHLETCLMDHRKRANDAEKPARQFCWAGVRNFSYPIVVDGIKEATILYGQCRPIDEYSRSVSEQSFSKFVTRIGVSESLRERLHLLFLKLPAVDDKVLLINGEGKLSRMVTWFGSAISEIKKTEKAIFKVNHELANHTTGVYSRAYELIDMLPTDNENLKQKSQELLYALRRLRTTIENFGSFLGDYSMSPCNLYSEIEKSVAIYRSLADAKGVKFRIYSRDQKNFPSFMASRKHLEIALNNLVYNSVKYSYRGYHRDSVRPIVIEIAGEYTDAGFIMEIQNFGVGILAEEIESDAIFEAGYQGKLTEGEYRDGGGYGLAIVKEILDVHETRISISSKKSGGSAYITTVTLLFPNLRSSL